MAIRRSFKFDIISVGDATYDTFVTIDNASMLCSLDKDSCWLCLNYSEKIPIQALHTSMGGNACNNAVGSSRLGLKTALYSIIGSDEPGDKILAGIKKDNVATDYVIQDKKGATNYAVVIHYRTDRTILVYHEPRKYVLPKLGSAEWIYLTSLGKGFEKIHNQLKSQLKGTKTQLAFNPGTHQLLAGAKALEPILVMTKVLLVNKEEAETLLSDHNHTSIKGLLQGLRHLGPEINVITDGENGAYAFDGKDYYRLKPLPAKVLERTGAGDSFSTGFLAGLTHGLSIHESMLWGGANSASVIEHFGPQAGLLTKSQVLARIKKSGLKCCTVMK